MNSKIETLKRWNPLLIIGAIIAIVVILDPSAHRDLTLTQTISSLFIGGALSLWISEFNSSIEDLKILQISLIVACAICLFNMGDPKVVAKITVIHSVFAILAVCVVSLFLGTTLSIIIASGGGIWWLAISLFLIIIFYLIPWILEHWSFILLFLALLILWLFISNLKD